MRIFIVLLTLFLAINAQATDLKTKEDARKLAKEVMGKVVDGDMVAGLQLLKPYFKIPESEFNVMVEQLKLQEPVMSQRFGSTVGIEFIKEEEVGNSLMRIIYLQKLEKYGMRWRFIFYKPVDSWIVSTFYTDDKIESLFCN